MRLQRILPFLVFALPVLIVGFAALMGGSSLAEATGDAPGAHVMRWIAAASAILLFMDVVLLVGALGVRAMAEDHWRELRWQRRRTRGRSRRQGPGRPHRGGEGRPEPGGERGPG